MDVLATPDRGYIADRYKPDRCLMQTEIEHLTRYVKAFEFHEAEQTLEASKEELKHLDAKQQELKTRVAKTTNEAENLKQNVDILEKKRDTVWHTPALIAPGAPVSLTCTVCLTGNGLRAN